MSDQDDGCMFAFLGLILLGVILTSLWTYTHQKDDIDGLREDVAHLQTAEAQR